ncbi:MAG: 3-isopropylmalate dehydratase [Candidatus Lokiarchaeota archaeon]
MEKIQGNVHIFGENINTDDIVPSHCLTLRDEDEMAQFTCENIYPNFAKNVKSGDVIIAGENFGCGSSREEAVNVLKILGISAIIAKSFARIYFRNAINLGIPAITLNWSDKDFSDGDTVEINLQDGVIRNKSKKKKLQFKEFPPFLFRILENGGIVNLLKKRLHQD